MFFVFVCSLKAGKGNEERSLTLYYVFPLVITWLIVRVSWFDGVGFAALSRRRI